MAIQALEKRTRQIEALEKENTAIKMEMEILKNGMVKENAELKQILAALIKKMDLLAATLNHNAEPMSVSKVE